MHFHTDHAPVRRLYHHRSGSVAEQHAGSPVRPVQKFAEHVGPNHQSRPVNARLDKRVGRVQGEHKSRAGRADIITGRVHRPDLFLYLTGPVGEAVVR